MTDNDARAEQRPESPEVAARTVLFTILSFVGAHVLGGQIAEEFPDAHAISVRAWLYAYARATGERISAARAAMAPARAVGGASKAAELERLADLRDRGALTEDEFAAAKRELLSLP